MGADRSRLWRHRRAGPAPHHRVVRSALHVAAVRPESRFRQLRSDRSWRAPLRWRRSLCVLAFRNRIMKHTLLALTLTASSAFAQQAPPPAATAQVDTRLAAWVGCWRLEDDLAGTAARMCITPEKNGVRLQTIAGGNRGIDEVVIPDGIAHPISDKECQGTESAEWSKDGVRVFRSTNVTCGKE